MIDERLLNKSEIIPDEPEPDPTVDKGRAVTLPAGLTLLELQNLPASEIDEKIKAQAAGIGYAGMLKLAAGHGKTPAGTQFHACAFLLNRAAELEREAKEDTNLSARLRSLPREQLVELIDSYERKALNASLTGQRPIDVEYSGEA